MIVDVTFDYWQLGVVPPGCRKPRDVHEVGLTQVEIPEVTGDQAPIAMRYPKGSKWADVYRWWGNQLWAPYVPSNYSVRSSGPVVPGSAPFPLRQHVSPSHDVPGSTEHQDQVAALACVPDLFGDYLIVDGVIWWPAEEPRYQIHTRHTGSTTLNVAMLDWHAVFRSAASQDRYRYFPADQCEVAKAEALRVASARGDSVDQINGSGCIEVLIPESVCCRPASELRYEDDLPFGLVDIYPTTDWNGRIERRHVRGHVMGAGSVTVLTTPTANVPTAPTNPATVQHEQGWTDQKLLRLALNFIASSPDGDLTPDFIHDLEFLAAEENATSTPR
ncbi:MAG: hypothetical protein ACOH1Y_09240 [Propionicimonas sp.]